MRTAQRENRESCTLEMPSRGLRHVGHMGEGRLSGHLQQMRVDCIRRSVLPNILLLRFLVAFWELLERKSAEISFETQGRFELGNY